MLKCGHSGFLCGLLHAVADCVTLQRAVKFQNAYLDSYLAYHELVLSETCIGWLKCTIRFLLALCLFSEFLAGPLSQHGCKKDTRRVSAVSPVSCPEFLMKEDSCVLFTKATDWRISVLTNNMKLNNESVRLNFALLLYIT